MQKKRLIGFLIVFLFFGIITNLYPQENKSYEETILRNRIIEVFGKESLIIFACEGIWGNLFEIAGYYTQYQKTTKEPTYDGFYVWMMENVIYAKEISKNGEKSWVWEFIADRKNHPTYIMIKYNYELLLKLSKKEE